MYGEDPREICQVVMYESVRRRFAQWLAEATYLTVVPGPPDAAQDALPTWLVVPDPAYTWPAVFASPDGPAT